METKEQELTRQERIEGFDAEIDRRSVRAAELSKEHDRLVLSLKKMDEAKAVEIERTLDSLPDATPKKIVDKVLQLPDEKRGQLIGNIQKLKIAVLNERRKADAALKEKSQLVHEIEESEKNKMCIKNYGILDEFIIRYNELESFYLQMLETYDQSYRVDSAWHLRGQHLGLSHVKMACIDSFMKFEVLPQLNMQELVNNCTDYSSAESEPLFPKLYHRQQDVPIEREGFFEESG